MHGFLLTIPYGLILVGGGKFESPKFKYFSSILKFSGFLVHMKTSI
uniref:Uncharacterized protein n=1 Tax=Cucumis melo TaxID=3656 RepID=A0A9I9EC32_CUCME